MTKYILDLMDKRRQSKMIKEKTCRDLHEVKAYVARTREHWCISMSRNKHTKTLVTACLTVSFILYTILYTYLTIQGKHSPRSVDDGEQVIRTTMSSRGWLNSNTETETNSIHYSTKNTSEKLSVSVDKQKSTRLNFCANCTASPMTHVWNFTTKVVKKDEPTSTRGYDANEMLEYFRPRIHDHERTLIFKLLKLFDRLMTENGMTYFLYGGSLVGSVRHHGLIPWDDDADVIVSFSHRMRLHRLLKTLFPDISTSYYTVHYWKIFPTDGKNASNLPWKWPFLDIFFYEENSTHIWDVSPQFSNSFTFPKSAMFPPRRRPFGEISLLAPNQPRTVLSTTYNISDCDSGSYVHKWERGTRSVVVPCSQLCSIHPFVSSVFMNGGCNETLVHKGNVVGVFFEWGRTCEQ